MTHVLRNETSGGGGEFVAGGALIASFEKVRKRRAVLCRVRILCRRFRLDSE